MKTLMTAAAALTLAAPAFAQVENVEAFFAQSNDSAAERIVPETSTGDVLQAQLKGALANESAAERDVEIVADDVTKADSDILTFFKSSKESPAEREAFLNQ